MTTTPAHARLCTRYNADGTSCEKKTVRADGWCGSCEGFQSRDRPAVPGPFDRQTSRDWKWQPVSSIPLSAEEAYEISVPHGPSRTFMERHGGTFDAAEAQIRSLLEDMLTMGYQAERREGSVWRLKFAHKAGNGYVLTLGQDLSAVIAYTTMHRERTWAQVKAGVQSRVSGKRHGAAWWGRLLESLDAEVTVRQKAASKYARSIGVSLNQGNAEELLPEVVRRVVLAMEGWSGDCGLFKLADSEDPDVMWVVRKGEGQKPEVVATYSAAADALAVSAVEGQEGSAGGV